MGKGCWGARYLPLDSLLRWLSKKVNRNGKRTMELIKEPIKEGYILFLGF